MWELPNRAADHGEDPTHNFCFSVEDIKAVVWDWVQKNSGDQEVLPILWHTHPSGLVGPSDIDLKQRTPGMKYLVVSLPNGEAVRF